MKTVPCICGCETIKRINRPSVFSSKKEFEKQDVPVGRCDKCGVIRHLDLPFTNENEYIQFYRDEYPPVHNTYVAKDYPHDRALARLRCEAYGIGYGSHERILDVGSGSGAFVEECRARGADAYGSEISKYSYSHLSENPYIYRRRLEDIHFPTDHFDKVVCHDALEHVLDPIAFLKEIFRITSQEGSFVLDFPNFYSVAGKHHWKPVEHIWYFTIDELKGVLADVGFTVMAVRHPIESKVVFHCLKPIQIRPKILLPPGMGDCYWSLVKMQSFLKQSNLGIPDVHIVCNKDEKFNGHLRSFPFLELFPFLHSTGKFFENGPRGSKLHEIWKEAYAKRGRTIFKNVLGCDYFIAYNGHLRFGESLESIDPDLECNWQPKMFVPIEEDRFKDECVSSFGRYVVFYFVFQGTYKYWTKKFPLNDVINFVNYVVRQTGCTPVFAGAKWDKEVDKELRTVVSSIADCVDLRGKTSIPQLFGLMKGSEAVIGYPSGLTIMSTVLNVKTLIIWSDYYNRDFAWNMAPPNVREKTYFIEQVSDMTKDSLNTRAVNLVLDGKMPKSPGRYPLPMKNIDQPPSAAPVAKRNRNKKQDRNKLMVLCVLKSGGLYNVKYVERLRNMLSRNTTVPFTFYCMTDMNVPNEICKTIPLKNLYERWWSKIEMFRSYDLPAERIFYFDLDTVIMKNIDDLFDLANMNGRFFALQPWNKKNRNNGLFASGMMSWPNGDFDFIYTNFDPSNTSKFKSGDQEYMTQVLIENGIEYIPIQRYIKGVYSYKRHCRTGPPADARIICFHGRPRPDEVKTQWMAEHWR